MKHETRNIPFILILLLLFFSCTRPEHSKVEDVTLTTSDTLLNQAFELAVWTIDHNTHNGLLEAGGGYGGEWTRDCAMNCWNAASLLRPEESKLYYLIDHQGHPHDYQEGLGLAFSMLFDILTPEESAQIVEHAYISEHGIPCVYPSFPRNTPDKPGRHNMMIWPHVNMYFASGCAHQKQYDFFYNELYNLADLAINRGEG